MKDELDENDCYDFATKQNKTTMMQVKFLVKHVFLTVIFCAQAPWTRLSRADRD